MMMAELSLAAIIPAAGFSSRMHAFKPMLKLGNKPLLAHSIGLFQQLGIADILVVLGHRHKELQPLVERLGANWIVNPNYPDGMFSSIQCGLQQLPPACDGFFLLPVDIPLVQPGTINQLIRNFSRNPSTLICYPQFDGRRGHPPLIKASLKRDILHFKGDGGLRALLRRHEADAITVPVVDQGIMMDADNPQQFSRLQRHHLSVHTQD